MAELHVGEYRYEHAAIVLRWAGATHEGARSMNEDSVFASFPVFLVADGMGGQASGDVASALAIESFRTLKGRTLATVDGVEQSVERAFRAVRHEAAWHGAAGGTTLAGAVAVDVGGVAHWYVLNVGDSRTYLLERGVLQQVSVDHSVVQELVDAGAVERTAARTHPQRHVITRAIGAGEELAPDSWLLPAEQGQRLLVCSDGLSSELDDDEIAGVLRATPSPADAAASLVARALRAGGRDNVTVVVVDVDEVSGAWELEDTHRGALVDDTVPTARRR
ncbi:MULTISPECIES: PP2C family protein-serine/threonine phosphatase [unclassified Agrococcus]|uniref:PP2C family protein-serine/threonine phosphatase n=1 Tax=unclassified Agrococcus TaxID=2615065 RepID=UPI0036181D63